MAGYVLRRIVQMVPLLVGITFLSFLIMNLAPGNFFTQLRMNPAISPELVRQLEQQFGYGDPLLVQYVKWVWRVLHLDLGMSVAYRVNVTDLIAMRVGNTVILALASMFLAWGLAIPMGILVALRPNTWLDRSLSFAAFFWMSLPSFFFAFLLMYLALQTGWFPVGGTISVYYDDLDWWGKIVDRARHLVLPALVLGTGGLASLMRLMRANILEIKEAEFVRTARAKGLPESIVVRRHILRNALNPFVTLAGAELGELLGGAALVEAVMNLQGMGTLILEAVQKLDTYVVMGSILIGSLLLLVGNLLADVLLTVVDPRIDFTRLQREG
ncbi:MAG: peptide ABC transporter permease [Candidatus Binatia bacterium]|nr:MAG: peptide ABC transporter permease [Candidatus Binatia bacterium]